MLFASLGRSIMGKTVSEVLNAALRLRPQAVLKTEYSFSQYGPPVSNGFKVELK